TGRQRELDPQRRTVSGEYSRCPQLQRRTTTVSKSCLGVLFGLSLMAFAHPVAWATPSSIIFIPSTDVQAPNTNHLGFDGYFSYNNPSSGTVTDLGSTRAFRGRLEVGVDHIGSQPQPWLANAKWQLLAPKG